MERVVLNLELISVDGNHGEARGHLPSSQNVLVFCLYSIDALVTAS